MYAFESRPRKGALHVLTVGCFIAALLLLGIGGLDGIAYPALYQFTAVVLLTAGVYLTARYILKLYRYEIVRSDIVDAVGQPQPELIISEFTGKRHRVVTRILLRDISAVALLDPKKDKAAEAAFIGDTKKVFRYINTPWAGRGIYMSIPEEASVVVIPSDDKMLDLLKKMTATDERSYER